MPDVLLKRTFVCPDGRFKPAPNGETVSIPNKIIAKYGLPSSARIVDENYVPPAKAKQQEDDETVSMTAARMEAEIRRRAEIEADKIAAERLAKMEAVEMTEEFQQEEVGADTDDIADVLGNSVKDVIAVLGDYGVEDLEYLLEAEKEGKNRGSLLVELEAVIEDRKGD